MILIDSLYINNSGGKILLDYLVQELEKSNSHFFYLFDIRCKTDFQNIPNHRKVFLKASLINRHRFYLKNKSAFSKVFCFGNLPPTIPLKVPVYTYLQQRLFVNIPSGLPIKQQIILEIKKIIFKKLLNNTDLLLVQTESMKNDFHNRYPSFKLQNIKILPFYEKLKYPKNDLRIKNRFIYVSGGAVHKNHIRLIQAFKNVYDTYKQGELVLTIDPSFTQLHNEISELINLGYPIINLGFISKDKLGKEYAKAQYSIFPSLSESFGLGIIEALEGGCKFIGADLDYTHTACSASLVFNPKSIEDIEFAFVKAMENKLKPSQQKIHNNIVSLINLLNE